LCLRFSKLFLHFILSFVAIYLDLYSFPTRRSSDLVALKGLAQQVLALAVGVELARRVDGHDIAHKVQVAEGYAGFQAVDADGPRSEEHTSELQSRFDLVCRLLLEKKKTHQKK